MYRAEGLVVESSEIHMAETVEGREQMGRYCRAHARAACVARQRRGAVPRRRSSHFSARTRLNNALADNLRETRLHRAIGVIYRPETELVSHYIDTRVADQFDVVLHIDHTRALEPSERTALWEQGQAPGTYPFGI